MRFQFLLLLTLFFSSCVNNEEVKVPVVQKETMNTKSIKEKSKKTASKKRKKVLSSSEKALRKVEKISEVRYLKKTQEVSIFVETEDQNFYTVVVEQEGEMTSVELMRFEVNKTGDIFAYDLQTGELLPLKKWQERYKSEYGGK